jgi:glycosyltransferase involved in cell wall biosynthesis
VIVNSRGSLIKLNQHYHLAVERTAVVPNGVDLSVFAIKESRAEARTRLGLPAAETLLAYVGRLETAGVNKGVDLLVTAFKSLENQLVDTKLYIIGGPNELVKSGDKNIIYTGHIAYGLIPLYLRALDLLVIPLPSGRHAETTSPIKLFEFMAAGKPVVAPDFSTFRDYVDEWSAFFFRPDDAGDLARVIQSALADPAELAKRASAARTRAANLTWHKRATQILNLL